jgi:PKD repeat protein
MPQITCPFCGNTIGLNERREIDHKLILDALKSGPKRFTDLYHTTHLSRKTLTLRLKDLCETKTVVKHDGRYCLNGAYRHRGGREMFIKNIGKGFSVATRNLRIIALLLLWLTPTATLIYALETHPAEIKVVLQPPIASFNVSPKSEPNVGWEVEGAKVIAGVTTVTFDAYSSTDPDGHISQYIWDFGDGNLGTGVSTTYVYSCPGTYVVRLTVIDDAHLSGTASREVVVYSQPTTRIYLSGVPENLEVDSAITVYILVADVDGLYGWQAGLTFNPNALECLSFEKGDSSPHLETNITLFYDEGIFKETQGATMWFQPRIDNELGYISPAGCTLIRGLAPASGSGILAKATFKVLSSSSFNLKLTDVMLIDKDSTEIPVIVSNNP